MSSISGCADVRNNKEKIVKSAVFSSWGGNMGSDVGGNRESDREVCLQCRKPDIILSVISGFHSD